MIIKALMPVTSGDNTWQRKERGRERERTSGASLIINSLSTVYSALTCCWECALLWEVAVGVRRAVIGSLESLSSGHRAKRGVRRLLRDSRWRGMKNISKIIKKGYFRSRIKLRQRFALSSVTELPPVSHYSRGKFVFSKTLRTWWSLHPFFSLCL